MYQHKPRVTLPDEKYDVYTLLRERDQLVDNYSEIFSDAINETLLKLNMTLLNSLQHNVVQVNCHAFLYWDEILLKSLNHFDESQILILIYSIENRKSSETYLKWFTD